MEARVPIARIRWTDRLLLRCCGFICGPQSIGFALRPFAKIAALEHIKARSRMHPVVSRQWHVARIDGVSDATEPFCGTTGIIIRPAGEVETLPPFSNVVGEPPGNRRHVAVPRPLGFMRVAVVTGSA